MSRYMVHTAKGPKRRTVYGKTRKEAADKLAKVLSDRTPRASSTTTRT